jgi:hypothetical protein
MSGLGKNRHRLTSKAGRSKHWLASDGDKMVERPEKITFAEMRAAGVRRVLIYCRDYRCSHLNIVPDDADRWPNELLISDIEDKFVCTTCGRRGADIRPDWQSAERMGPAPEGPPMKFVESREELLCARVHARPHPPPQP